MHDSEQEHSGITGCRVTYESTIFYNEANKFSIIVVKTSDPRIPPQACSGRYYGDRMLRLTAGGGGPTPFPESFVHCTIPCHPRRSADCRTDRKMVPEKEIIAPSYKRE